jgi:uncharacterized protein (DUF952 family)
MLIYKILHFSEWSEAKANREYAGSAKDRADGFLHFSLAKQLHGTLSRYYAKEDDLALVAVESDVLGDALKFEPSSNGEHYPHLYGALPISAVKWVRALKRGEHGGFVLPI